MYTIKATKKFEKDVKRCIKRRLPMEKLKEVVRLLGNTGKLPAVFRPHKLSGKFSDKWECHITPDWLLVWEQDDSELIRAVRLKTIN